MVLLTLMRLLSKIVLALNGIVGETGLHRKSVADGNWQTVN